MVGTSGFFCMSFCLRKCTFVPSVGGGGGGAGGGGGGRVFFLYNVCIFVLMQQDCLALTVFALAPCSSSK